MYVGWYMRRTNFATYSRIAGGGDKSVGGV